MSKIRTQTKKLAILTVAAIALAACGGSNGNSNSDSTDAARTKNAALATLSCATGGACAVGDVGPGGGKVFYVAPSSFTSTGSACGSTCTYLEAAPTGWITASTPAGQVNCLPASTSTVNPEYPVTPGTSTDDPRCVWSGNTLSKIGTTLTAIGTGYANTSAMIDQDSTAGRAGTAARAFQGGRKTDWYLPSRDELDQLYKARTIIGVLASDYFWSSSEGDRPEKAYDQYFGTGARPYYNKSSAFYVRPVRAFSVGATVAPTTTVTPTTVRPTTTTTTSTTVKPVVTVPPTTIKTTTTVALTCATGGRCAVGDTGPGGGKVFYVAPSSFTSTGSACGSTCTYLEAAPAGWITASTPAKQINCVTPGTSTADPRCAWSGKTSSKIGTTRTAIGTGYANTSAMINQDSTSGKAGTVARGFQGGGKTDWYLPSKDELSQMHTQRSAIGVVASNTGVPAEYWSSSEIYDGGAWSFFFPAVLQFNQQKKLSLYVRPVRAF